MVGELAEVVLPEPEPEPSAERLLPEWHLAAARDWLPHQFVPWGSAPDFDGSLKTLSQESAQSTPSQPVQNALIINLLTEDNPPGHHFEIATRFGRDGAWELGVMSTTGLGAAGRQAQDRLGQHVEWLETQAPRARGLRRMNAGSAAGPLAARKQEIQA
ncbi:acyl-ACP desaturase [Streptomyces sp. NPDC093510]|uniref:acyl-ACP desaturase n=1 Tax=Streptomyces sp. NPDC093510 TaxID=3155199 RepID=UPI0034499E4D